MKIKPIIALTALALGLNASASLIAIVDSGTDMKHEVFDQKTWINLNEIPDNARDEDRNGYEDDIYGWNFAESNNQVIDYSYLGTLNDDIRKFFDVQAKAIMGTVSDEELAWMRAKVQEQEFIKKLQVYGNFMHGTHVAGISAKKSEDAQIMAVKLIPTEVKLPGQKSDIKDKGIIEILVKKGIDALAKQQMNMMEEISEYVNGHQARVANGSFGTGYPQAKMIVETVYKQILRKEPNAAEVEKYAKYFINALIREGERMPKASPNTLWVFAAGNDGLNNDDYPTSPTNIQAENVISVAATISYNSLAPFSNHGEKMVDVAAPGVAIHSAAPGNEYLKVSGTSQAAPFVAGVAGAILDMNKNLSPAQVREILMGTVDHKDFLVGKVSTSGIVNTERALRAAELSLKLDLGTAIRNAKVDIADVSTSKKSLRAPVMVEGMIRPLPSNFIVK